MTRTRQVSIFIVSMLSLVVSDMAAARSWSRVRNAVPVISGTPSTTATVGLTYSFTPTASDANNDTLGFSITNKPSWATFNTATGKLSGVPGAVAVGTYSNITIRVSDQRATTSLSPFSITVVASSVSNSSSSSSSANTSSSSSSSSSSGAGLPTSAPFYTTTTSSNTANAYAKSPAYTAANGAKYYVRSNVWNAGSTAFSSQTTWASSEKDWGIQATATNDGQVKSYPSVVRWWATGEGIQVPSGTIKQIKALTKAKLAVSFTGPSSCSTVGAGVDHRINVLWDLYTHNKQAPTGTDLPVTSIMINQYDIDCDLYYGGKARDAQVMTLGGQTWRVWIHTSSWASGNTIELFPGPYSSDWKVTGTKSLNVDVLPVIKDLAALGYLSENEYLTSVQFGFEPIAGNPGTYAVTNFCTSVDGDADCGASSSSSSSSSTSSVASSSASSSTSSAASSVSSTPASSTTGARWIFNNGVRYFTSDYSYSGMVCNWADPSGAALCSGPGGAQPAVDGAGMDIRGMKYLVFSINPSTANVRMKTEAVSVGDIFDGVPAFYINQAKYGPEVMTVGQWNNYKIPLADLWPGGVVRPSWYKNFLTPDSAATFYVNAWGFTAD